MAEMERCEHNEEATMLMSVALDGQLDDQERQWLDGHLAACAACRAEWAAMQQVSTMLEESSMVGPPYGFAIRVERQLAERDQKRRRLFGGAAVLTSSLSLAGVTIAALAAIVVGLVAWQWFGSLPSVQQGTTALSQMASGMGLMGKGASLFLGDLLLRYGLPVLVVMAVGLVVLSGLWLWLFIRRPDRHHHNGFA